MSLVLKVACPDCFETHDANALGAEIRCQRCGKDFRAQADGEGGSRILSVTPEDMEDIPYSQRSTEVPVNSKSSIISSDPALLSDKLLMTAPMRNNSRWVGKVQLIKKIGQGGMGAVYQGFDESLALDVAVKILPLPVGQRDEQFVQRFRQEARISAQINHPHVVRTLNVDEEGELIYLVMDYIQSQNARSLVDSKGPLPYSQALQIIHDVALGVQAAHAHGVIHRDIKPDNILVADDGRIVLTDLGLAKAVGTHGSGSRMPVTRMGLLLGTPEYMSPEQWEIGADVGIASDIWSLGATLWMLLTGKPPFVERDLALLSKRTREEPLPDIRLVRSDLPDCVLDILFRCLAKRAQERYMNCSEIIAATQMALEELSKGRAQVTHRTQMIVAAPVDRPSHATSALTAKMAVSVIAAPRPTLVIEKKQKHNPWKTWIGVPVLAAAVAGSVAYFLPRANSGPAMSMASAISVSPVARLVKPGQDAEISADATAFENAKVEWEFNGQRAEGATLRTPIERDTLFTAVVKDAAGKEIARKAVKVYVELQASAAEKPLYEIEAGSTLKLQGDVRGGEPADTLVRWIQDTNPDKVLSETLTLELPADGPQAGLGRHTFIMQARRKTDADWRYAATASVVVNSARKSSPDFANAMERGVKARELAFQSATGAEALSHWKTAIESFENAASLSPDSDAANQASVSRKQQDQEQKYLTLLTEARRLRDVAEQKLEVDGVTRLGAWSDAQRPIAAALVLYERGEARALSDAIEQKLKDLRAALQDAEQARANYDSRIARARTAVREAKKYLNPSVALPHWETAAGLFKELTRDYPVRADEFTLEQREADENRDKAYLYDKLGIVPSKIEERVQDIPQKPSDKTKVPSKGIDVKAR